MFSNRYLYPLYIYYTKVNTIINGQTVYNNYDNLIKIVVIVTVYNINASPSGFHALDYFYC